MELNEVSTGNHSFIIWLQFRIDVCSSVFVANGQNKLAARDCAFFGQNVDRFNRPPDSKSAPMEPMMVELWYEENGRWCELNPQGRYVYHRSVRIRSTRPHIHIPSGQLPNKSQTGIATFLGLYAREKQSP